jgi:hypothetical protein
MARLEIFLSFLTVESRLADILRSHIDSDFLGLAHVFQATDVTSIPVGAQWFESVLTGLQASELHLVLCSPESINRPWIHYEAGAAGIRRIPTVPLCHSGLKHEQLPVPLSQSQGVQLADAAGIRALYDTIAKKLSSNIPNVDFEAYAKEVQEFEQQYYLDSEHSRALGETVLDNERIVEPRVVCVTSPQFLELGFQNQIEIVQKAFPDVVQHSIITESGDLRERLATETIDVLHIATYVCPRTGDLYFSEVDPDTGASLAEKPDVVTPEALAELVNRAKTRLVVVGSCESLVLAANLLAVTNVVATRDMVSALMMARWVDVFYSTLPKQPLSEAFDVAVMASGAKMRLFARSPVHVGSPATDAALA